MLKKCCVVCAVLAVVIGVMMNAPRVSGQIIEAGVPGLDAEIPAGDPIVGEWWFDGSRSYYAATPGANGWTPTNRTGERPKTARNNLGKWIVTPEGNGLRVRQFTGNGPDSPTMPATQFYVTGDGRPWAGPQAQGAPGQLMQLWRLEPHVLVALVHQNGNPAKRLEWQTYTVTTDGRRMSVISWLPEAPNLYNVQSFVKHAGPTYNDTGTNGPQPRVVPRGPRVEVPAGLFGTWLMAVDKTTYLRRRGADGRPLQVAVNEEGPQLQTQPRVPGVQKWTFDKVQDGFTLSHWRNDEVPLPGSTFFGRLDGSDYPDPHGPGRNEMVAYWPIDATTWIRRVRTGGTTSEWVIYGFSPDWRTMSILSWDESTPWNFNTQVFNKK